MSFQTINDYVDVSRLDKRLQLQRRVVAQNALGQATETWSTIRTVWASLRPMSGREVEAAGAKFADARYQVVMRFQPDVYVTRGEHRFLANQEQWQMAGYTWDNSHGTWQDQHLDIVDAINPNSRGSIVICTCKEWAR